MESVKDGERCEVSAGTHKGKSGIVRDVHTSKTGHVTITVVQDNGVRFKTLAKNVKMQAGANYPLKRLKNLRSENRAKGWDRFPGNLSNQVQAQAVVAVRE